MLKIFLCHRTSKMLHIIILSSLAMLIAAAPKCSYPTTYSCAPYMKNLGDKANYNPELLNGKATYLKASFGKPTCQNLKWDATEDKIAITKATYFANGTIDNADIYYYNITTPPYNFTLYQEDVYVPGRKTPITLNLRFKTGFYTGEKCETHWNCDATNRCYSVFVTVFDPKASLEDCEECFKILRTIGFEDPKEVSTDCAEKGIPELPLALPTVNNNI